ncbi:ATP-binding protein [Streptomyces sulfonofaciens]|uniref:ATP-binding protein n=1 Tax=Streptomyces sulfonofaciens TaxID=68272 RepID=UPI0016769E26|nr:ATP-binding protein [Streptomyces sulfonofaciens]
MTEAEVQADSSPGAPGGRGVRSTSIAQARDLARRRLRGLDKQLVDDCLLVVSELVTNAIRHGGGLVHLDVITQPGHVTVSVQDRSSALPTSAAPTGQWLPGGYGWPMVCRLAKQVTINQLEGGGKAIHVSIAR